MDPLPATNTIPDSGNPAALAPGSSHEGLPGSAGAESPHAAKSPAKELSSSEILDAWLAGTDGAKDDAATPPPGDEGTESAAADAADEEGEQAEDLQHSAGDDSNTDKDEQDDDPKPAGQLDHLIDAVLKAPAEQRKDSPAYKRLSKIMGEPAALKRQLAEATGKLKDAQGPPIVVRTASEADPWAAVATEADFTKGLSQVKASKANAEQWIDWCQDNKEGGAPPGADPDKGYLDEAAVKALLNQSRSYLRWANSTLEAAPAKQAWLKQMSETRTALLQSNPELFEKDNPELAAAVQLLEEGRISTTHPDYMRDALDLLAGRRLREEEQRGVKSVKLDTKAAAAKAAGGKSGSESSQSRPGPQGAAPGTRSPAARPASAGTDLEATKKKAQAGDTKSLAVLIDAFASAA